MKRIVFILALVWLTLPLFCQTVNIGDILCTDGSIVSREAYATSGRTAEGIVFFVDDNGQQGWVVSVDCQAINTHWVTEDHYYDLLDIPGLANYELSREAINDLDGYSNTFIIRDTHGADWFPAAWSVDFDNGWYLPAAGQIRWLMAYINEINVSLAIANGTTFVYDHPRWYWTSTERGEAHAVVVSQTGSVANYPKFNYIGQYEIGVRAVKTIALQTQGPNIGQIIDAPNGQPGIVFYVSPDDSTYWLVAMDDLPSTYQWGLANDLPSLDNYNENDQYVTLHGVHCGLDATMVMREAMGTASQYASSHVDLEDGWHIPSAGQLSKLFAALPFIDSALINGGGTSLNSYSYWTSTECSNQKAWTIRFDPSSHTSGIFIADDKTESFAVRPIWSPSCETPLPEPSLPDNIIETECNLPWEGFEWGIREDWSTSDNIYCRIMPLVGDLDDDGIPEIVCFDMEGNDLNQIAAKTINVYDGQSKALKAQISMNGMVWAHGNGPYGLVKLPNRKGLIITACKDRKLHAYDITSDNPNNPVWVSNADYNTGNNDFSVSIGFADFNGDRFPEIYVRNKVFDAETGTLLAVAQGGNNQADSYSHGSHTNHDKISCPLAFNICGDTRQELILGNEIYEVIITNRNGTSGNQVTLIKNITPPDNIIADGHVQVADFNLDGHLDVLVSNRDSEGVTGNVSFYVWDVHNNTTSQPIKLNTSFIGKSIPLISDFDGDGSLEMLIDCCHEPNLGLRAYRFNPTSNSFSYLWSLPIDEDSYSNTATLFDFNGDGRNELVFTDNSNLWIYDLGTVPPTLLSQIDCGEITIMQVPIVADVDADGSAEIVVTGKEGGYLQANTKLKVYKSSTEPWIPARKVWNQYMYHVTNVNEDLTIPTYCFNTATTFTAPDGTVRRPYNNFLQQAYYINQYGEPYNPGGIVEIDIDGTGCNSFIFNDSTYTENGLYDQIIESPDGCDTVYHINVSLGEDISHDFWRVHCYSYTWNDSTYTESGIYQQTFHLPEGCDSTAVMHLQILDTIRHEWSQTACNSYTWNDVTYTEPGDYVQHFEAEHGCDSIATLHLTFSDAMEFEADTIACGSFQWEGIEYLESGDYDRMFVTPGGCDSLIHMHLTIAPFPEDVPEIDGLTEVYVSTDLILGQYFYSIDSVPFADHYEWELDGADWPMDTTGLGCALWVTTPGTATLHVKAWNGCGFSEREIIIHAGFYDVDDFQNIPVALYPNPAKEKVVIESENMLRIRLIDIQGQVLADIECNNSNTFSLDVTHCASGIYIIEIVTERGTARKKIDVRQ